jgi:general secretion pathway protein M
MDALLAWYRALTEREQRAVLIGAVACAALLLLAVLLPFERRVARSEQTVQTKAADLLWLKSVAPQLAALRNTAPASGGESLVVLADRVARETGIARSLTGSQPIGNGDLSVQMEHVAFDALVNWAGELVQHHGVRIVSATIDGGASAGAVSATFVLHAP